jgi:uncharacterized FlgJ-related protein
MQHMGKALDALESLKAVLQADFEKKRQEFLRRQQEEKRKKEEEEQRLIKAEQERVEQERLRMEQAEVDRRRDAEENQRRNLVNAAVTAADVIPTAMPVSLDSIPSTYMLDSHDDAQIKYVILFVSNASLNFVCVCVCVCVCKN